MLEDEATTPGGMPWEHAGEWLFQWPMMVSAAWWEMVWNAGHPWRSPHKPEHADLAVPDPIEEEGERALFA